MEKGEPTRLGRLPLELAAAEPGVDAQSTACQATACQSAACSQTLRYTQPASRAPAIGASQNSHS